MTKIKAPKMVYVSGEEMTRYTMDLILKKWIDPIFDTSAWEFFDLSCISRDKTQDKVLQDIVDAGSRIKSIFKEPTITPTEEQRIAMGLSKAWGSPNGAMRRGWNGITISRDTIHIKGLELGYKNPVLFDRHAVGGEYSANFKMVGKGTLKTTFTDESGVEHIVTDKKLTDNLSAVVTYTNPLDNVYDLAKHFFSRSLEAKVTPYVVTKKTVFKWQEDFWKIMKEVFDKDFKNKFIEANLLPSGKLEHLISDNAAMKIVSWKSGGFSMVAHNYDGDMLTDEVSQVHMSPGFITSSLVGIADSGEMIKEFEASHGTVSDMYQNMLAGKETSLNPLGLAHALWAAMKHADILENGKPTQVSEICDKQYDILCKLMATGKGTRDLCGSSGLTTEAFIDEVAKQI